ncbi:MAG: TIGR03546 family protein [Gemmatimonadota bacterium]|nr:TIGR03546 family protein [Gemmatimonadota bacterium]
MLWFIRFVQRLVKALNSEGTPGQVAAGVTLGAAVGMTPLLSLHNLVFVLVILFFNISVPGAVLGWVFFGTAAFLLDPLFDRAGAWILTDGGVLPELFATVYNTPVLAFTNLTNTVVLGSLMGWLALAVPIFFGARWAIARYRKHIYERYKDARAFKAIRATKAYDVYRLFRP